MDILIVGNHETDVFLSRNCVTIEETCGVGMSHITALNSD